MNSTREQSCRPPKIESRLTVLKSEHGKALKCYERALFFTNVECPDDGHLYKFPPTERNYAEAINRLYSVAGILLGHRHYNIYEKYKALHKALDAVTIVPDREVSSIIDSAGWVGEKFGNLGSDAAELVCTAPPLAEIRWCWLGMDNICHLFMDEITHLVSRVDALQGRLNTRDSEFLTRRSLRYAVWGIGIGAGLSLLSLLSA